MAERRAARGATILVAALAVLAVTPATGRVADAAVPARIADRGRPAERHSDPPPPPPTDTPVPAPSVPPVPITLAPPPPTGTLIPTPTPKPTPVPTLGPSPTPVTLPDVTITPSALPEPTTVTVQPSASPQPLLPAGRSDGAGMFVAGLLLGLFVLAGGSIALLVTLR